MGMGLVQWLEQKLDQGWGEYLAPVLAPVKASQLVLMLVQESAHE
jgi:hypothetical protein